MDHPAWTDAIENPYLHGIHGPVTGESEGEDLPVEGELPAELFGAHLRNGPNSVHAPTNQYHWFDGDGMVHGVYFRDGSASYRSRFVKTAGLADEAAKGESIWPGVMGPFDFDAPRHYLKDTGNTDLIWHAGSGSSWAILYMIVDGLSPDERVIAEVKGLTRGLPVTIVGGAGDE